MAVRKKKDVNSDQKIILHHNRRSANHHRSIISPDLLNQTDLERRTN